MPYFVTISGKSNNLIKQKKKKKNPRKLLNKKKGKKKIEEEEEQTVLLKSLFQNKSNICLQVFEVSHLIKALYYIFTDVDCHSH